VSKKKTEAIKSLTERKKTVMDFKKNWSRQNNDDGFQKKKRSHQNSDRWNMGAIISVKNMFLNVIRSTRPSKRA